MTRPPEKYRLGLWVHIQAGDRQPLWAGAGGRTEEICINFSEPQPPLPGPSAAGWVILELQMLFLPCMGVWTGSPSQGWGSAASSTSGLRATDGQRPELTVRKPGLSPGWDLVPQ